MNITIPSDLNTQIASSTSDMIYSIRGPAELIAGVLLAFLILELIIININRQPNGK